MTEQMNRNIEIVQQGFQAWASRDIDTLMSLIDDNCEWNQPGQATISGLYRGKDQIYQLLTLLAQKTLVVEPTRTFADGDTVVVLTGGKLEDEQIQGVQVFTLNDSGKITHTQVFGDTALQERVYGRRVGATAHSN